MVLEVIATADLSRQILSARLLRNGAGHARSSHYGKKPMALRSQHLDSVQRWRYDRGKGCASSNSDRLDPKVEGTTFFLAGAIALSSCGRQVKEARRESAPITPHVQGCYVAVAVTAVRYLTLSRITLSVLFFRPKRDEDDSLDDFRVWDARDPYAQDRCSGPIRSSFWKLCDPAPARVQVQSSSTGVGCEARELGILDQPPGF
ncbi:hypothetical protein BC827DRAFT_466012 [Russula dissimulans]|nr:hypothetical protein BC827DRAFT_466012 [Russula dissimulans]